MSSLTDAPRRILIMGNSGSGKSTLGRRLADEHGLTHLDLDPFAWLPTDPPERMPLAEAEGSIRAALDEGQGWVVEGCYADLLGVLAEDATELVYLALPVETCQAHARARPWEPHKYPSREAQDANLAMLLEWIAAYPERQGPMGRAAHVELFERFGGSKRRVTA